MKKEIYLVLDNIRSRENVGSIFRTADAAGVAKIYLCGITPTPKMNYESRIMNYGSDKIAKTALGAEKWVPWEYRKQTWRCLLEIKNQNSTPTPKGRGSDRSVGEVKIIGLEKTKNSKNIFRGSRGLTSVGLRLNLNKKIALVVGNEVRGLSPKILKYCDKVVHIPMCGRKESLNVAVAAGIAVYAILNPVR